MTELYEALNAEIARALRRKKALEYESPVDVDRHDDDLRAVKKRIELLRSFRTEIEEIL